MPQTNIQYSFHAGEWAPALNARVDLAKYDAAAALLENFFVDYRGGASSRPGTKYVIQAFNSNSDVRVISFQASFAVGYVLEFGDHYIRFIRLGAPVLQATQNITNITQANPGVVTCVGHGYSNLNTVFINGVVGMTQVNGKYFLVDNVTANTFQLKDLNNQPVNTTGYSAYISGGTVARVYSISSPYAGPDLQGLKFTQDLDRLIICHPDYVPYELVFISETNWTISAINFGTTIAAPSLTTFGTTLAAGTVNYAYAVTAVNDIGEESLQSNTLFAGSYQDLRTTAGSNFLTFTAVAGASYYNIYKAQVSYLVVVPSGSAVGYIGSTQGTTFVDSNISPDFSQTIPIAQNPFSGAGVASYIVTVPGAYTTVPAVTVASSGGSSSATASAVLSVVGTPTVAAGGAGYLVGDLINLPNSVVLRVATLGGGGAVATVDPVITPPSSGGLIFSGATPTNPVAQVSTSGAGAGATFNLTWGVSQLIPGASGAGYSSPPAVSFSPVGAAATAVLGAAFDLNPSVPGLFQQRLVLGGLAGLPQTFFMSQPGAAYNFNITNPVQPDNAISASLVSGQLNTIKSMVATATGLLLFTDRATWLVSGSSTTEGVAVTPSNISANPHSYIGANDVPPILVNNHVLFVQAKGSVVRDLAYSVYTNIFTGTDISVLSSHLFYGYEILQWAWAEEPFKLAWAIRDDGTALTLTYLKEQELIGWTHSVTGGGANPVNSFTSVCTIAEETDLTGLVDAVYFVVEREVNGFTVKYIERLAERIFPNGAEDAWCVDAGLQYNGAPATNFSGGEHLAGLTVTGLADGLVITPFVMPVNGNFTLATPASKVTVGLGYDCKFQSLQIDVEAAGGTVQGKEKRISGVTVRAQETLGIEIGSTFNTLKPMKDFIIGNIGSDTNERVTNLVTGDAYTIIDPKWSTQGQFCIQQSNPWPVSILGVIPEITVANAER